jgi:hypothetical protein
VTDLVELMAGPHLTPAERRKLLKPAWKSKGLYAAAPGTGPDGETCGSCAHIAHVRFANVYRKCGLMRVKWTGGGGTDIKARSAACSKWEPAK